jgi:ribosomal protein L37AE/L43A
LFLFDAVQTLYPTVEATSMFVSTRVSLQSEVLFFFVGQPRAGQQTHAGHRSGDSMQFVAAAAKQMVTIGLNEYYTSQKCKECGSQLVRTRGWSVRFWRCPHSELNGTGKNIHVNAVDKTSNSSSSGRAGGRTASGGTWPRRTRT